MVERSAPAAARVGAKQRKERMRYTRRLTTALAIAFLMITAQAPAPAYAWESYATYNGGTFRRAPDNQPIMNKQLEYVWCVASGTQAWIDYARLVGRFKNR